MDNVIKWTKQNNHSESYRYEHNGIRATYGMYDVPHWNANDLNRKHDCFQSGSACDVLTARVAAEHAIMDLFRQRGEAPPVSLLDLSSNE